MTRRKQGHPPFITDKDVYNAILALTSLGDGRPPAVTKVAEVIGTVKSNTYTHITRLVEAGLVKRVPGFHGTVIVGGTWKPPAYPTKSFDKRGRLNISDRKVKDGA